MCIFLTAFAVNGKVDTARKQHFCTLILFLLMSIYILKPINNNWRRIAAEKIIYSSKISNMH